MWLPSIIPGSEPVKSVIFMTSSLSVKSLFSPKVRPYFLLAVIWFFVSVFFLTLGPVRPTPGFPLDDAWIHFDFAKNTALGHGFGLNPGEPSTGSTSPLWVLLLAGFYKLGVPFEFSGIVLGALFLLLTVFFVYKTAFAITSDSSCAFFSSVLVLFSGRFLWGSFSGMEISLFSFLSILGIYLHLKNLPRGIFSLWPAVVFGLASLARPEGHLLFVLALTDLVYQAFRQKRKVRGWLCGYLFIYAVFVLPYMFFSWILTHHFLCSSYYSKMLFTWHLQAGPYLKGYLKVLWRDNPLLFLFMIPGLIFLVKRRSYLPVAWLVLYPLAAAVVSPILLHHARYQMPLLPLYILAGWTGVRLLLGRRGQYIVLAFFLVWGAFFVTAWGQRYGADAVSFHRQHFLVAQWLKARTMPGEAVATNDIGILSYAGGRNIVDLCGIINPDIIRTVMACPNLDERRMRLWRYLAARHVRYLAFYRSWFPWIKGECLKKVYEVRYPENTAAACDTMEVFQILCNG